MTQKHRPPIYRVPQPRPEVLVVQGEPLAALFVYQDLCLLQRRHKNGVWCGHPVAPDEVARVLGRVPLTSGLLPEHCLAYGRHNGQAFYAVWVPPRTATLRTPERDYTLPLPALVWAGHGQDYRIWALASPDRPTAGWEPLMHAPFPNCYTDGRICWGNTELRSSASPETLPRVLKLFLEDSFFNAHVMQGRSRRFPVSVLAQWDVLVEERATTYPLDDLCPTGLTLEQVCSGAVWGLR